MGWGCGGWGEVGQDKLAHRNELSILNGFRGRKQKDRKPGLHSTHDLVAGIRFATNYFIFP